MVKCEGCGFLALRNRLTGELDEVPEDYRSKAEIPRFRRPNMAPRVATWAVWFDHPYSGVPTCSVRAHPLHNEFANKPIAEASREEISATLTKERNCSDRGLFTTWQQGFTPKEHREMLDRQWAHNQQRNQNWINLGVALLAVFVAAFGIWSSSNNNKEAARLQADATLKAAQMQIDAIRPTPTPEPPK